MLAELPHAVAARARVVQGLLLQEPAASLDGVALADERSSPSPIRPVERRLNRVAAQALGIKTDGPAPVKLAAGVPAPKEQTAGPDTAREQEHTRQEAGTGSATQ